MLRANPLVAAAMAAKPSVHSRSIALDARLERLAQTSLGHRLQQKVSRRFRPVAGNQNWDQVHATVLARCPPAALARFTASALAFAEAQEEGFVRFDHAGQLRRLNGLRQFQEAMTLTKCRSLGHIQSAGCLARTQTLLQLILLAQPLGLQAQPGQRRGAKRVEGAPTGSTFVALQTAGVAVANDPGTMAVRTGPLFDQARLGQQQDFFVLVTWIQRGQQLCPLTREQLRHRNQQSLQFRCLHHKLHLPATQGNVAHCDSRVAYGVSLSLVVWSQVR